jgi:hypothetical protein
MLACNVMLLLSHVEAFVFEHNVLFCMRTLLEYYQDLTCLATVREKEEPV